jgi:streptogramin lyase
MSKRTPLAPTLLLLAASTGAAAGGLESIDALSGRAVRAIAQDSRGFLWIGTEDGLTRYDGLRIVRYLPGRRITALHEQRGGLLWAGTASGLYRLDDDGASFVAEELPGAPRVHDLLEGDDGALWIATANGLYRRGASATPIDLGGEPAALELDAVGNLWVLVRDDAARATLHRLSPDGSGRKAFPLGAYRETFLVSASGEMWFDLEGPIDDRESPLTPAVAGRLPTAFVAEDDGRVWIGTPDGLWVNEGSAHALRQLTEQAVLAAYRDREGRLWFGTREGLLHAPPPAGPAPLSAPLLTSLVVSDEERQLEAEFLGIQFDPDREVRYRHRLEGFDEQWVETGMRRFARYTNLPPGSYRFRVQASLDGDFEAATESAAPVVFAAAVHETFWFRGGLLLLLAAALLLAHRARVRRIRSTERERASAEAILGELLRDIVARAGARPLNVDLQPAGGVLVLELADDGVAGAGLEEIAARAGAELTIQSESDGATRVRVEVPLA